MTRCMSLVLLTATIAATGCASGTGALKPAAPADASAPAVLWRDPGPIGALDLYWGPGARRARARGPFRFVEEDTSGTNPKITVKDARGGTWDMKFDEEVHAEVAANRIVWALGYVVEDQYFVQSGIVTGAKGLTRAPQAHRAGRRVQERALPLPRTRRRRAPRKNGRCSATRSSDSKELSGLTILMTLINNWDIEGPRNNRVLRATLPRRARRAAVPGRRIWAPRSAGWAAARSPTTPSGTSTISGRRSSSRRSSDGHAAPGPRRLRPRYRSRAARARALVRRPCVAADDGAAAPRVRGRRRHAGGGGRLHREGDGKDRAAASRGPCAVLSRQASALSAFSFSASGCFM